MSGASERGGRGGFGREYRAKRALNENSNSQQTHRLKVVAEAGIAGAAEVDADVVDAGGAEAGAVEAGVAATRKRFGPQVRRTVTWCRLRLWALH